MSVREVIAVIRHLVPAAIRPAPPVEAQPVVVLAEWRVFAAGLAVILAGVLTKPLRLRVTAPIQSWQPASRTWITSSGREYHTPNPPTNDALLQGFLERYVQVQAETGDVVDVTDDYWQRILEATQ